MKYNFIIAPYLFIMGLYFKNLNNNNFVMPGFIDSFELIQAGKSNQLKNASSH